MYYMNVLALAELRALIPSVIKYIRGLIIYIYFQVYICSIYMYTFTHPVFTIDTVLVASGSRGQVGVEPL